jgi:hypothetical protein
MEARSSSDTSVLTRATRRNIQEDAILHSHRRENLKSQSKISIFNQIFSNAEDRNRQSIGEQMTDIVEAGFCFQACGLPFHEPYEVKVRQRVKVKAKVR